MIINTRRDANFHFTPLTAGDAHGPATKHTHAALLVVNNIAASTATPSLIGLTTPTQRSFFATQIETVKYGVFFNAAHQMSPR